MAVNATDIALTRIVRSFGRDESGQNVPIYEIHFTIRGDGDFVAAVPISRYTAQNAQTAIYKVADPIIQTLDMFPK